MTPNCMLCKWHILQDYAIIGCRMLCSAQALVMADEVYNNDICQKLYEKNEDKI